MASENTFRKLQTVYLTESFTSLNNYSVKNSSREMYGEKIYNIFLNSRLTFISIKCTLEARIDLYLRIIVYPL